MPSPNAYQNAFQNAGHNGSFFYNDVGNQTSTFVVLFLAIIMLVALLKSEARYRQLLEELHLRRDQTGGN